jgi:ribosome maturation factor RimP
MQVNLEKITLAAQQAAASCGLLLLEVSLGNAGKARVLQITVHRSSGLVSMSDCAKVSGELDGLFEPDGLLQGSWLLEVQSPGLDRKLKGTREFEIFSGRHVEVKTKQKVDNLGSAFTGKLCGLINDKVIIDKPKKLTQEHSKRKKIQPAPESAPAEIELSNIICLRLHPEILESRNTDFSQLNNSSEDNT